MEIQWLGHSAFTIRADGKALLIDPFFTDSATCPDDVETLLGAVDVIAVTHGHWDHLGDTLRLAKVHGVPVICIAEIAKWLVAQGHEAVMPMNIGGAVEAEGFRCAMVQAIHSAGLFQDGQSLYMGISAGFVIQAGRWSIYHAGDTALFSDMALIQRLYRPNVGLLPVGGRFTMDAEAAALACNEFLDLEIVVPMHFKTFPVIAQDAEAFKGRVERGRVEVLAPGEILTLAD